jgi:hypothetical protein
MAKVHVASLSAVMFGGAGGGFKAAGFILNQATEFISR